MKKIGVLWEYYVLKNGPESQKNSVFVFTTALYFQSKFSYHPNTMLRLILYKRYRCFHTVLPSVDSKPKERYWEHYKMYHKKLKDV